MRSRNDCHVKLKFMRIASVMNSDRFTMSRSMIPRSSFRSEMCSEMTLLVGALHAGRSFGSARTLSVVAIRRPPFTLSGSASSTPTGSGRRWSNATVLWRIETPSGQLCPKHVQLARGARPETLNRGRITVRRRAAHRSRAAQAAAGASDSSRTLTESTHRLPCPQARSSGAMAASLPLRFHATTVTRAARPSARAGTGRQQAPVAARRPAQARAVVGNPRVV